ncbi:tyrosine-type recombinase/integrase [Paeniroseomonas aquatica]
MRTAITRFERVNGALGFADITDEHARRFKASLIADEGLKNATKRKLWGMLGALMSVAVNDRLVEDNPFARVKISLNDDSAAREVLTSNDLAKVFGKLPLEEWWIARIGLYSGARLGEICQLTKGDIQIIDGVACIVIRPDAEAGKSVKTRSSIRKVPIHRQLFADGLLEWVEGRPGDRLFTFDHAAASKRLNRRMRDAGMGEGKVFHSFRHTFKGVARRYMEQEWHDHLTGHAAASVGQTYGDYDLRTLKEKLDLIDFGFDRFTNI